MTFEAIYVLVSVGDESEMAERIRSLVPQWDQPSWLRYRRDSGFLQLMPTDLEKAGLAYADYFALLTDTSALHERARLLSEKLDAEVLSLQGQTSVDYVRFYRWRAGICVRRLERCWQMDADELAPDVGEPEDWEDPDASDPIVKEVGEALALPGFATFPDADPYWTFE